MTTAYFLLGRISRISWALGDSHTMTSRPKWEELAREILVWAWPASLREIGSLEECSLAVMMNTFNL